MWVVPSCCTGVLPGATTAGANIANQQNGGCCAKSRLLVPANEMYSILVFLILLQPVTSHTRTSRVPKPHKTILGSRSYLPKNRQKLKAMVLGSKPTNVKINSSFQGSLPLTSGQFACKAPDAQPPLRLHVSFPLRLSYPFHFFFAMCNTIYKNVFSFRARNGEVTNRLFVSDELAELATAHFGVLGCGVIPILRPKWSPGSEHMVPEKK